MGGRYASSNQFISPQNTRENSNVLFEEIVLCWIARKYVVHSYHNTFFETGAYIFIYCLQQNICHFNKINKFIFIFTKNLTKRTSVMLHQRGIQVSGRDEVLISCVKLNNNLKTFRNERRKDNYGLLLHHSSIPPHHFSRDWTGVYMSKCLYSNIVLVPTSLEF